MEFTLSISGDAERTLREEAQKALEAKRQEKFIGAPLEAKLRDAAASLAVGSAWELGSRVTPLTQSPGSALRRALTVLDPGEEWLLEPKPPRLMFSETFAVETRLPPEISAPVR